MDRALYLVMYGAKQAFQMMQASNNNLANTNTTGFRADLLSFDSYPVEGGALPSRIYDELFTRGADLRQGATVDTGRKLDVAIQGEGWIAVQNLNGAEAYTRAGNLQINANGLLTTADGKLVMGNQGPVTIPPVQNIYIGSDGSINAQLPGQTPDTLTVIDRIKLVKPPANQLQKGEDGLFYLAGGVGAADADPSVQVESGSLEGSNVNSVAELVKLIDTSRNMEAQLKMVQVFEQNADAAASLLNLPA